MLTLLRRFMRPYGAKALVGILTKAVEVVFEVLTPLVVARMIDEGIPSGDVGVVVRYGLLLLVFTAVSYVFTLVCQKLAANVSQHVGTDLRNALFRKVGHLATVDVDRFGTPSLVTRVTNDVNQVQLAVAIGIRMLTRWPLLALGSIVAAILIDVRLGLVFLVCLPLITITFALVMRASIPYYRAMQQRLDRVSLVTRETLAGMRVVKAFRQEGRERERGEEAIREQADVSIAVGRLSAVLNPATFIIMYFGVAAILWIGGMRVDAGDLTTGDVIAFVSYMTQALVSVSYLANLVVVLMRGHTSSVRILEVLDAPDAPSAKSPRELPRECEAGGVALEFRNVTFSYPDAGMPALRDVSLRLGAGETMGVIGGTGSGKSTLVQLVPRVYDPTDGSVSVFGVDVRDLDEGELRGVVSVVPQDVSLVTGTVRANLAWRDPEASEEDLWVALERAQAADFVRKLPQGLDAPVEAGGKNFSGGQRQRLTIARALVGNPRLVILDDAASALDYATDARLRATLRTLRESLTTVIVSQRVAAVRSADKIVVLDHGVVAGIGTHDELVRECPLYREICTSQLESKEVSHG